MTATAAQVRHILARQEDTLKVRITSGGQVHQLKRGPHGDGQSKPVWLLYAISIREAAQRLGLD